MEDYLFSGPGSPGSSDQQSPVNPESPYSRGPIQPTVVQKGPVVEDSTWASLREAINHGDISSKPKSQIEEKATRRALLVAVQYRNDPRFQRGEGRLESTPNDIWRIYEMLRKHQYEPQNIRILTEGVIDDRACDPTKQNILSSLRWLVEDTQEHDRRYFHFSGHGQAFESNREQGKEARKIPQKTNKAQDDDTELKEAHGRVLSQDIRGNEFRYYNEAILTSHLDPTYDIKDEVEISNWNRILDSELNTAFAQLPAGSILTCTMDCCHSGRIINNNFKLLGAGFRGGTYGSTENDIIQPQLARLPQIQESIDRGELRIEDDLIRSAGSIDERSLTVEIPAHRALKYESTVRGELTVEDDSIRSDGIIEEGSLTMGDPVHAASQDIYTPQEAGAHGDRGLKLAWSAVAWFTSPVRTRNFFFPPAIRSMPDSLPAEEANRDNIKATMLTWSGCHQRQTAGDYGNSQGGYFTLAFTDAVKTAEDAITVHQLYDRVEANIAKVLQKKLKLQYTQVWTSLGGADTSEALAKLDQPFII